MEMELGIYIVVALFIISFTVLISVDPKGIVNKATETMVAKKIPKLTLTQPPKSH